MPPVGRMRLGGLALRAVAVMAIVIAVQVLAGSGPGGSAHADNGPHGSVGPTSDGCAGCHRIHTASAPGLLLEAGLNFCLTCHDGSGADTDVVDGLYLGLPGRGLKAGGITNALMDTDWDTASSSSATSSHHTVDGSSGTAWGNGAIGSGPGAAGFALSCVTCHNPHGKAGSGGTATYRILRPIPLGSGAAAGVDVSDETPKTCGVASASNQYFGEPYGPLMDPLSDWCVQCHTRYLAPAGSATTDSGDSIFAYQHMTYTDGSFNCAACHDFSGGGPFFPPNPHDLPADVFHSIGCTTCHVSHGTSASMDTYSGAVEWPDDSTTPSGHERSSLLRLDNRGECQVCHAR